VNDQDSPLSEGQKPNAYEQRDEGFAIYPRTGLTPQMIFDTGTFSTTRGPKCIVCGKPERDRLHRDFEKIAAAEDSQWG
jgi:hypothetical protein